MPVHLQKSFNSSYHKVNNNVAWFEKNHPKLEKWTKTTIHELGLDVDDTTSSTPSTGPSVGETSTLKPQSSSAQSTVFNVQVTLWILLICNMLYFF